MPLTPRPVIEKPETRLRPRIIPVPVRKEVKRSVSEHIQKAAQICGKFYTSIARQAPESKICDAFRDASKGKILDVRSDAKKGIYSMQITLRGKPMILTLKDSVSKLEVMLTDRAGNQIEYMKQQGKKLTIA